jgi:hypothetical protein
MRRHSAALLLLLLSAVAVCARQQQPAPGDARLVDEYGSINISDTAARMDNFAVELQNTPTHTGYIVVYPQLNKFPAWQLRRAYWCRGYLTESRGLAPERVVVLNGGFADEVRTQLWIAPTGAPTPVPPFDLAAALSREKTPHLYDRHVYENAPPVAEGIYENYVSRKESYEPFVAALRADPAARGFIIAYARRRDRRGADRRLAAREKLSVLKLHPLGADRIVTGGGGLRSHRTLEFWIVPPGAPLPEPTPTVRPKRRTRR